MKFPPATPLKPLDLAGPLHKSPRKLEARDLDPAARLEKPAAAATSQHDKIVKQARNWVAQTFFGTLLKQMENSPFKSEMFSGGRGGEAFSSMYHQRLAEHMARGAGSKLVNSVVRGIEAKQGSGGRVQSSEVRGQSSGKKEGTQPDLRSRTRQGAYKRTPNARTLDLVS